MWYVFVQLLKPFYDINLEWVKLVPHKRRTTSGEIMYLFISMN